MALLFIALVLLPINQTIAIQICYTLVAAFAGLWQIGVVKCAQLVIKNLILKFFVYTI